MSPVPKRDVVSSFFRTTNLDLASYLVASGRLVLDHVEASTRSRSEFYFHDKDGVGPSISNDYFTKDLKVSAKLLLEARTSLINELKRGREAL